MSTLAVSLADSPIRRIAMLTPRTIAPVIMAVAMPLVTF